MVILYTSPGCASCRKAKQWLKDNQIEFVEKNIFTSLLKESEIKYLLSRCEMEQKISFLFVRRHSRHFKKISMIIR